MDIKRFFKLLRQWHSVILLGLLLGAASGYLTSMLMKPTYQAKTKILVTSSSDSTSEFAYLSDQQLTQTYMEFLTLQPLLETASKRLNFEIDPDQVFVQQLRDTQIILVTIEDSDPDRAADIANMLYTVLIEQNDELDAARYETTETSLMQSIDKIERQMAALQNQFDTNAEGEYEDQLTTVSEQIAAIKSEMSTLQGEITRLNNLTIPEDPLDPPIALTLAQQISLAENQSRLTQLNPLLTFYQELEANLLLMKQPIASSTTATDIDPELAQLQTTISLYQEIYFTLLNNLENLRIERTKSTPNIVQIEPAEPPNRPLRPLPIVYTILAMMVGGILATGTFILIELLDDSIKVPADIQQHLGLPILGTIPETREWELRPEGEQTDGHSGQPFPIKEAFQCMRLNIEAMSRKEPIRTLFVISPEIGEGKTTVAENLATSFKQSGKKVALIRADNPIDEQPQLMGFNQQYGADLVIFDGCPAFIANSREIAAKVDKVLLVVRPWYTRIDDAVSTVDQLRQAGAEVMGVVINRIPGDKAFYYESYQKNPQLYMAYEAQHAEFLQEPASRKTFDQMLTISNAITTTGQIPESSLLGRLQTIEEERTNRNQVYPLWSLLGMLVLGGLEEDGEGSIKSYWQEGIAHWNQIACDLGFDSSASPPSYSTVRYILSKFDPNSFANAASVWIEHWTKLNKVNLSHKGNGSEHLIESDSSIIEVIQSLSAWINQLLESKTLQAGEHFENALVLMKTEPELITMN